LNQLSDLRVWVGLTIHHKNPSVGNCRPRVSATTLDLPSKWWSTLWESLDDATLAPDAISFWAKPLRPVAGSSRPDEEAAGHDYHLQRQQ